MFDPDVYRKTCSESLRLSEEKLEEMIVMAENKKHGLRRPLQIALIAAALVCMMCVTAAAANPEMVTQIWRSLSISVIYEDENTLVIQTDMPEISVERVDERVILTVDNEQLDITEALERDGVFTQTLEGEKGTAELTVQADLTWGLTMSMEGGKVSSYHSDDEFVVKFPGGLGVELTDGDLGAAMTQSDSGVSYTFADDTDQK